MGIRTALKFTYRAFVQRDPYARYRIAEKVVDRLYPTYKFTEYGGAFHADAEFLKWYESWNGSANYHSLDRKYTVNQLLKLVENIPGDTAECGAYRGMTSWLICRQMKEQGRRHFVFDSFEGLSQPGDRDGNFWTTGDLTAAESEIRRNLREFDFVDYLKGWIPERFPEVADRKFAFVHIDVDLYQPTRDSIEFFYDRLSPGGILLCDDYGFEQCPGARSAMDDFFRSRPEQIVLLPTGQGWIMKQSTAAAVAA